MQFDCTYSIRPNSVLGECRVVVVVFAVVVAFDVAAAFAVAAVDWDCFDSAVSSRCYMDAAALQISCAEADMDQYLGAGL